MDRCNYATNEILRRYFLWEANLMKTLHVKIKDDGKAAAVRELLKELPFVEIAEDSEQGPDIRQEIMKYAGMLQDLSDDEFESFCNAAQRRSLLGNRDVRL